MLVIGERINATRKKVGEAVQNSAHLNDGAGFGNVGVKDLCTVGAGKNSLIHIPADFTAVNIKGAYFLCRAVGVERRAGGGIDMRVRGIELATKVVGKADRPALLWGHSLMGSMSQEEAADIMPWRGLEAHPAVLHVELSFAYFADIHESGESP